MRVHDVSKYFGPSVALDHVDLDVRPGVIHGLVGHNGSGKSTLSKIITGFHAPDSGYIDYEEQGSEHNVAAIHQDLCLLDEMTIVENFGVVTSYDTAEFGLVSWHGQRQLVAEQLSYLGVGCQPRQLVGTLAPAEKAAVAIARAVSELDRRGRRGVLVVDEATAYFSQREISRVRTILRQLADDGHSIIFISHNLQEVLATCDTITVLRNGRVVDTLDAAVTNESALISAMLGRTLESFYPPMVDAPEGAQEPMLRLVNISDHQIRRFSLNVLPGEVVGVTGILGTGFDRIPYLIAGTERAHEGSMQVAGSAVALDAQALRAAGVSLVPANRAAHGLWMDESAVWNYTLFRLGRFWRRGRMKKDAERSATRAALSEFGVVPSEPNLPLSAFSGGNQQKVLLASRLEPTETRVLLLHEPTQGVDSGAKLEILAIVQKAALMGTSVVIFSSDHEELVNTCSRVLIMSTQGSVAAELESAGLSEDDLVAACLAAG